MKPLMMNRGETSAAESGRKDETGFMEGETVQGSGNENHAEQELQLVDRTASRADLERS